MTQSEQNQKFEQLVQKFSPQSNLLRAWELKGGISAQVTALELQQPDGQLQKMVVRRHGPVDLKNNPHIAADEFKLLQILQSGELAAPQPYYLDQSGEIFATPYLVMEFIEGETDFAPANLDDFIRQLAAHLASIHKLDSSKFDLAFLPDQIKKYTLKLRERPAQLDDSLDEGLIRATLEAGWPLPQFNKSGLLHGDYWPGNTLWKNGQLVAVIDWEDAEFGDQLADLANSRLEILWAFGLEAMQNFTEHYKAISPLDFTNLPYWDLFAALRPASKISDWAGDELTEKTMRQGHKLFITQAFQKLSNQ